MSALQSLSSMVLQLHPLQGLQQELLSKATGRSCHGQLTASSKRARVGRLKVEQQLYALLPDAGIEVFAAPEGAAVDARLLVETALVQQKLQQKQQQQKQQQQPAEATAQAAPAAAAAAVGAVGGSGDELSQKISSSMRLEVSEQVNEAQLLLHACVHSLVPHWYSLSNLSMRSVVTSIPGWGPPTDDMCFLCNGCPLIHCSCG
jgi:hypothetical protein